MSQLAATPAYSVLVPVKPTATGKSRLRALGDRARSDLALAFAEDTVTAALACAWVDHVVIVTNDLEVGRRLAVVGATVVPDGGHGDLNAGLTQAAADLHRRNGTARTAALCADLPALRAEELDAALSRASNDAMSFLADTDGVGTTLVTAPDLERFRPMFGPGSRAAHLGASTAEVSGDLPSVRRDVDTPDHLAAALALGVGPRTRQAVRRLGLAALPS